MRLCFGKRVRCRARIILWWCLVLTVCYYARPFFFPIEINIQDWDFTDHNKCPACFGESLCPDLYHDRIRLTNWTRFTVSRLFNAKNYFHATHEGKPIVLKKLGHESELRQLDRRICERARQSPMHCHSGHYIKALTSYYAPPGQLEGTLDYQKMAQHKETEVLECAQTQRLMDTLVQRSMYHRSATSLENTLTLLMLNPEPVIFMAFPQEEGWPFPQYLGGCGRLAAFENAGEMLTSYYMKPWPVRVQLGRQLLQMATKFTSNDLNIALYLTDWSTDNFAVDRSGKLTLIDGENLILVDQKNLEEVKSPGWNTKHTSGGDGCEEHFCYAGEDLCTHQVSDHNLFGVCRGILAGNPYSKEMPLGLLHSMPGDVGRRHPLFARFLKECATPSHPGGRFEAAELLLEILKDL